MFALETRRLASANRSHISFHVAKFLATAGGMVNLVKKFPLHGKFGCFSYSVHACWIL